MKHFIAAVLLTFSTSLAVAQQYQSGANISGSNTIPPISLTQPEASLQERTGKQFIFSGDALPENPKDHLGRYTHQWVVGDPIKVIAIPESLKSTLSQFNIGDVVRLEAPDGKTYVVMITPNNTMHIVQ